MTETNLCDLRPFIAPQDLQLKTAKKTKPLRAKHIQHLLTDTSILVKFLLATLEGNQMLKGSSMVCIGGDDDVWQQPPEKLLKKYDVKGVDEHGWLICEPKPENEVWAAQFIDEQFRIIAQWGERQSDGTSVQYGQPGDYICQSKSDPTDVWIVAKKIFESTYSFVG